MADRGICDRCKKPAIKHNGGWVCANCGTERPHDPERDVKKRRKPSGSYVWKK